MGREKYREMEKFGAKQFLFTERGTTFGCNNRSRRSRQRSGGGAALCFGTPPIPCTPRRRGRFHLG